MATRGYTRSRTVTAVDESTGQVYTYLVEDDALRMEWRNSPRVNGKLRLRGNPMNRNKNSLTSFWYQSAAACNLNGARFQSGRDPFSVHGPALASAFSSLYASAYARLRGKLYKGGASLGVTLGSAKQSADMINNRFLVLNNKAARLSAKLGRIPVKDLLKARNARQFRHLPKSIANAYLEVIFGWTPLLADIHAAGHALASIKPDYQTVKVKQSGPFHGVQNKAFGTSSFDGELHVTLALGVSVSNPNAWMLERLGLLNPVAVAWDLVPWSFVVNMFVNTGQLVNSLTDFTGLAFDSEGTYTQAIRGVGAETVLYNKRRSQATWVATPNRRTLLGMPPPPRLTAKLPEMNLSTAAMAAALFVQQFTRVAGLLNPNLTMKG